MDVRQPPIVVEVRDRHDSFLRHLGRIALLYVGLGFAGAFVTFIVEAYVHFPSERPSLSFSLGALSGLASVLILIRLDLIRHDWAVKVAPLLQARMLEWKARSFRRNTVADTLVELEVLKYSLQREVGKQIFASFGECTVVVVVNEENYFGCLFFQHALENIGFYVTLEPTDFGRVVQRTLFNIIYFIPPSKQLVTLFPDAISLHGIASGDIASWDALVKWLPELPHGADLLLRRYFKLAASRVVPPESLGATSGVTSYRS